MHIILISYTIAPEEKKLALELKEASQAEQDIEMLAIQKNERDQAKKIKLEAKKSMEHALNAEMKVR